MRISFLLIALSSILFLSCTSSKKECLLYVGTYTENNSEGIYCYRYESENGQLAFKNVTSNKSNPSFLEMNPDGSNLYAVSELAGTDKSPKGAVVAYLIEDSGELTKLNEEATHGKHPCHVTVSPNGKTVVASSYSSGSLSIFDVGKDGSLKPLKQLIEHQGSGPNKKRQKAPHAHSALFSPDGKLLISADLGTDKIDLYKLSNNGIYVPNKQQFVSMPPGSGPRHFDFSPDEKFMYVLNELTSTVTVLRKNGETYQQMQTCSSLPDDFLEPNKGADIHVSADGRFVYSSNRGHNSIAVFQRDKNTGLIELIQHADVHGDWPRNFAIAPDGKFLLVANQYSNNITIHAIDSRTGMLTYTGNMVEVPSPVCLKFKLH